MNRTFQEQQIEQLMIKTHAPSVAVPININGQPISMPITNGRFAESSKSCIAPVRREGKTDRQYIPDTSTLR